jgi:hypothetical protein
VDRHSTRDRLIGELAAALGAAEGSNGRRKQETGVRRAAAAIRPDLGLAATLLDGMASDLRVAADVSRRSYWHSNGFAKLVVHVNDEPGFRLRLHVWPSDAGHGSGYENIHNHRWPFASIVLAGAIRVEQFQEIDDFDQPGAVVCNRLIYDAAAPGRVGQLRVEGKCALRKLGRPVYPAGTVYFCDTDMLHTVARASGGTAATLMLAGAASGTDALVYQDVRREPLADTDEAIGPDEVMALTGEALDAMRAAGPSVSVSGETPDHP